ncbi:MAG: DEAD/DEAH box helicase, partial [Caulobacter sp.]
MSFPPTHPALARALAAQGYENPTPIQAAVLEADAEGRDLLVSAQTGSGKTVAFGLAAAPSLLGDEETFGPAAAPLALVIAPTRELAIQVERELTWLYAQAGARIVSCVGGMDLRKQMRDLNFGAHIVVGTPGRLRDHVERDRLDLSELRVVVLDEADEMLDMGFREDLTFILDAAPETRRTLLFSATIAREIANLAKTYQRDALRIDTTNKDVPHGDIEYRAVRCAPNEVEHAVVNVLRFFESPGALVFCNTRDGVRHMHARLRERGFSVVGLSGELTQKERADALQALRDGHARVCVATDVAARGLDLPDLGLVIHADLPVNRATLLHRSGRTGRAGKKGVSVLIAPYTRRRKAEMLLDAAAVEGVWENPPTADSIRAKDKTRMLSDPLLTETASEDDLAMGRAILESRTPEEVAAALARVYRSRLPEPEDMFADGATQEIRRGDRPEREVRERPAPEDVVWFRVNVGRAKNADPKWLIPLICRLGHVLKKDIGSIRIFDRETKFEITKEAEPKFSAAVAATSEDDIRIEPSTPPAARSEGPRGPRPERKFEGPRPERRFDGPRPERRERPKFDGPRPERAERS